MALNLKKNLCIFDLETTGLDISQDRIIEISILKVAPSGEEENLTLRLNPEIPISQESSDIHGITYEDIKDAPTFKEVANQIADFIGDADLAGFNSNRFDIPVLAEEFLRINHTFRIQDRNFIDVQNIFHKMEQRTLVAAYKYYCNKNLENAHSANADVKATYEVLKAQIAKYEELENNVNFLADFSYVGTSKIADFAGRLAINEKEKLMYNFGKYKGKTIEEIDKTDPGYYGWVMNGNFPLYTKSVLKQEMNQIKAKRQEKKQFEEEKKQKQMENKLEALKNKFSK